MEDPSTSNDLAVETFYNSSGNFIRRIVHIIDTLATTKHINEIDIAELLKLLDQFQEWPQLLDPYLQHIVSRCSSLLAEILLFGDNPGLSAPISQFLYVLCKVRGRKVVVKFFRNEAQLLQPLLLSFSSCFDNTQTSDIQRCWEEEYVGLLWLAYMMTGAFALAHAVDDEAFHIRPHDADSDLDDISPKVVTALVYIAKVYLDSAGQQRNAAGVLLGQLIRRHDLQNVGVHHALMRWSTRIVLEENFEASVLSYRVVGHLAFWAQYAKAAIGHSNLTKQVAELWDSFVADCVDEESKRRLLTNQTCLLKLVRYMASRKAWSASNKQYYAAIQDLIRLQFEELENPTTVVRYAAGKALGHVVSGQATSMSAEILDFLFSNLDQDWEEWRERMPHYHHGLNLGADDEMNMDLTTFSVPNHDLWHGHLLALAHMLMMRAVPSQFLARCCQSAIVALSFSQISPSGTLIGENVRDAACWCVWALARKYVDAEELWNGSTSYLQTLATELIQVACLDPTNNIRRAASAALQELIGRNPNKISFGLELSTIVDSAGVSAGSSGMLLTTPRVSRLSDQYWQVMLHWLTSWRGIAHKSIAIRRTAAQSIGIIAVKSAKHVSATLQRLTTAFHVAEEHITRHGILMAVAAALQTIHHCFHDHTTLDCSQETVIELERNTDDITHSSLVIPSNLLALVNLEQSNLKSYENNSSFIESYEEAMAILLRDFAHLLQCVSSLPIEKLVLEGDDMAKLLEIVRGAFVHPEKRVREIALSAASSLLSLAPPSTRNQYVTSYAGAVENQRQMELMADSCLRILGLVYHLFPIENHEDLSTRQNELMQVMLAASRGTIIMKCAALFSIRSGPLASAHVNGNLVEVMIRCLEDYTTNSKLGDVGLHVRLEAVQTASYTLEGKLLDHVASREQLLARICALAVESSDKMRSTVATILGRNWEGFGLSEHARSIDGLSSSSTPYFMTFLDLSITLPRGSDILHGYVTSASSKAANTVCYASRTALKSWFHKNTKTSSINPMNMIVSCLSGSKGLPWPPRLSVAWLEMLEFCLNLTSHSTATAHLEPRVLHSTFAMTTRAHYQSHDLRLLDAAVGVYYEISNLALISTTDTSSSGTREYLKVRREVLLKLCSMLGHKFAKTRNAVADALYLALEDDQMMTVDFSRPPGENKGEIQRLKETVERLQ